MPIGGAVGGGVICGFEPESEAAVCEAAAPGTVGELLGADVLGLDVDFAVELIVTIAGLVSQARLVTPARTSV